MRPLLFALAAFIDGLMLHQFNRGIEVLNTSNTIKRMCRYALGVLGTWPIFIAMQIEHQDAVLCASDTHTFDGQRRMLRKQVMWSAVTFIYSFLFVGIGSFVGYVIDSLLESISGDEQ